MKRLILCLSLCLALAACGGTATPPPPAAAVVEKPAAPVLDFLAANEQGASATLDDPQFGTGVLVLVGDRFFSATGEECKRATLTAGDRGAEVVVVCRQADGVWRLAPRIWGQGLSQ